MASYGRRYYSRRYPRRSSRRTYSSTSRSKRRAIGNYRAAVQQRDKTDVNISIAHKFTCNTSTLTYSENVGNNTVEYTKNKGVYALNIWDLLRRSDFYQSYANMYDQIKINSIRIKLTPIAFSTYGEDGVIANNIYQTYTVVTAWDRTGLSPQQGHMLYDANSNDLKVIGTSGDSFGYYVCLNGSDISTYSSAITKPMSPNSNTTIVRAMYPSSLAEKSFYANTSDLREWYPSFDYEKVRWYGFENPNAVTGKSQQTISGNTYETAPLQTIDSFAKMSNPCFINETAQIPFKPTLLVGLLNDQYIYGFDNNDHQNIAIHPKASFNLEADIGVSFRGLRKAPIVV